MAGIVVYAARQARAVRPGGKARCPLTAGLSAAQPRSVEAVHPRWYPGFIGRGRLPAAQAEPGPVWYGMAIPGEAGDV